MFTGCLGGARSPRWGVWSTMSSSVEAVTVLDGGDAGWRRARALCHDLRQPLAAILITSSSLAAADMEMDVGVREALDRIQQQTSAMVEMVRGALGETPGPRPLAVGGLVEDVADLERVTWTGRLEFVLPEEGSPGVALADPAVLRRAVANLIENAVRAAGPHGLVRVRVTVGEWVDIAVEDDGPGFGATSPGTGLGLGIVRDAASQFGGTLDLGDSPLGGVVAHLRLPLFGESALEAAS